MNLALQFHKLVKQETLLHPFRLGMLVHLAALVSPVSRNVLTPKGLQHVDAWCAVINPGSLASRTRESRGKMVMAVTELEKAGVVLVDKKRFGKGIWLVDLSPAKDLLVDGDVVDLPAEVPHAKLRSVWEEAHTNALKHNWTTTMPVADTRAWIRLYEEHGDKLFPAIERYFSESNWERWSPSVTGFAKSIHKWLGKQERLSPGGMWA